MVTSCFLSKQWSRREEKGGGGGDADQCVVDAVFLECMQRNMLQKRLCAFQAERVVCSVLTQLHRLKLKDSAGVFLKLFSNY